MSEEKQDNQEWAQIEEIETKTTTNTKNIINIASETDESVIENIKREFVDEFEKMNLKTELLRGIMCYGFEKPSLIQQCTIPIILTKRDLIAQSQSGTGKTGSFVVGALERLNMNISSPTGIILSPTRELSLQIESVAREIGKYMKVKIELAVGGTQLDTKKISTCNLIIGTPGRVLHILQRNLLKASSMEIFVLDEADKLLEPDFQGDMEQIVNYLPETTQICLFSATLPEETLKTSMLFLRNPIRLLIPKEELSLKLIYQYFVDVKDENNKFDTLIDLYTSLSIGQCIIYCNNKNKVNRLKIDLDNAGHQSVAIHGGMETHERNEVMKKFRLGTCRLLITTDLLARGIDVQQVGFVINYDIPTDTECYLHRIGRSGRFGKKGVAINFITNRDSHLLKRIEEHYNTEIPDMPTPQFINSHILNA